MSLKYNSVGAICQNLYESCILEFANRYYVNTCVPTYNDNNFSFTQIHGSIRLKNCGFQHILEGTFLVILSKIRSVILAFFFFFTNTYLLWLLIVNFVIFEVWVNFTPRPRPIVQVLWSLSTKSVGIVSGRNFNFYWQQVTKRPRPRFLRLLPITSGLSQSAWIGQSSLQSPPTLYIMTN